MKRKILIEKKDGRIRTYFLEDDDIVEIHSTSVSGNTDDRHRLGDIYIGKVGNIVPNIGAAFIEIAPVNPGRKPSASATNWWCRSAGKQSKARRRP